MHLTKPVALIATSIALISLTVPSSLTYRLKTYASKYRRSAALFLITLASILGAAICCIVFGLAAINSNASKDLALKNLEQKNSQLAKARIEIKNQSEQRRFRMAVRTAAMFSGMPKGFSFPEFASPLELLKNAVVGFKHEALIAEDLKPLHSAIESMTHAESRFTDRFRKNLKGPGMPFSELFESALLDKPRDFQKKNKRQRQARTDFYKNLVVECTDEFGGKGTYLVSALNLLALSLIEQGEFDKAKLQLNKAISIAESDSKTACTKGLIELVKRLAQTDESQ